MRWTTYADDAEQRHVLLLVLGFGLLLVAAFVLYLGTMRSQWPVARAQVLTVEVRCQMRPDSNYLSRYGRRTVPVVIACDQVDRFRADNGSRHWSLTRLYQGDVRVTGDKGSTVVKMGLGGLGAPPRVGHQFEVVQNPDAPADVQFPQRSMTEILVACFAGGLGIFVLGAAFFLV